MHHRKNLPRETKHQTVIGPGALGAKESKERLNESEVRAESRKGRRGRAREGVGVFLFFFFLPHLWFCCWKAPPPPEVCTRASACADVAPLWNVQHSHDLHLLIHHRRLRRAHPAPRRCCRHLRPLESCCCDPRPLLPCWASSLAPFEGGPAAEWRVGETPPVHRPQGSGCTRSLLHRLHRSPQLGPRSEVEESPWPD